MIRVIHTISIVTLAAAGLISIYYIVTLARGDSRAPETATAIDRFVASRDNRSDASGHVPLLVQEAQTFALYLNPPRAVSAPSTSAEPSTSNVVTPLSMKPAGDVTIAASVRPPTSSAKFELHGISYYRQTPERSMALVLEPDGGRRWVHPGEQLGHLTIERIDCNSVVCRDGGQTQVIALASTEAITKYARAMDSELPRTAAGIVTKETGAGSPPKQAPNKNGGPEVPPPDPGVRQMPLARVAALLGQSS